MMNSCNKHAVRNELESIRGRIPPERRLEAKEALLAQLLSRLAPFHSILSFCSLPQEIDTASLNRTLATEGRLLLPKMEKNHLSLFQVTDLSEQLARFSWKGLEPIPDKCIARSIDTVDYVLVPALGFDETLMRIGYGKGCYDALIVHSKSINSKTHFIGIGFQEQLHVKQLPSQEHDMRVDELLLF